MTTETIQRVRMTFDAEAEEYFDSRMASSSFRAQQDILLGWMAPHYDRILDLGCGSGDMLLSLAHRSEHVTGVDLSHEMLNRAAKRDFDSRPVHLLQADCLGLPFPSESYDAVISMGVIEYVPDPQRMLNEIVRVLRPRGVLGLTLPHGQCVMRNLGLAAKAFAKSIRGRSPDAENVVVRRYESNEFDDVLRGCGMRKTHGEFCGIRLLPWPVSDYMPHLTAECNRAGERIRFLSGRRRLAGVYCVFSERM